MVALAAPLDEALDDGGGPLGVLADVGLPNSNDGPSVFSQQSDDATVAATIGFYLLRPIGGVSASLKLARQSRPMSSVPEISIAEHGYPRSRKDDIGLSWKRSYILAIAESAFPQINPQEVFMRGIGTAGHFLRVGTRSRCR